MPRTWRECSIGSRRAALLVLLALLAWAGAARSAAAAPVLVLGPGGHAAVRSDPFVTGPAITPQPAVSPVHTLRRRARRGRHRPEVTVLTELARMRRRHTISGTQYRSDVAAFRGALAAERRLRGTRRAELMAVTETMHGMAARHALTASRLPELFATLAANVQWWTSSAPVPAPNQRVEFTGSQLVWEYYPGQGIQLQVLGSFGRANGMYTAGPSQYPAMEQLLSELIPLAARRAGGLAWEYDFSFDGGVPPWTSAMSQATGLDALSRAYRATGDAYYLGVGTQALRIFTQAPPAGVAVAAAVGTRFLQYTFAPKTDIINAFLQTLIGLDAFAQVSGNSQAAQLFASGNAEAVAEVPQFDTGAWSLYQPGVEDDLSYHELVTGFLNQLCTLTQNPVYCTTAQHFTSYLTTPPVVAQLTRRSRARREVTLRFRLSKFSHVGVTVTGPSGRTVFATSASFPYGAESFTVPAQRRPGTYGVVLAATDLAGNFARSTGALTVTRAPAHSVRRGRRVRVLRRWRRAPAARQGARTGR